MQNGERVLRNLVLMTRYGKYFYDFILQLIPGVLELSILIDNFRIQ